MASKRNIRTDYPDNIDALERCIRDSSEIMPSDLGSLSHIERHVVSDRNIAEQRNISQMLDPSKRSISGSASFPNYRTLYECGVAVFRQNKDVIQNWVNENDGSNTLIVHGTIPANTTNLPGLRRTDKNGLQFEEVRCRETAIRLLKEPVCDLGIVVNSIYPYAKTGIPTERSLYYAIKRNLVFQAYAPGIQARILADHPKPAHHSGFEELSQRIASDAKSIEKHIRSDNEYER